MELVTIHYPHPDVADSEVPETAVDQWRQLGWLTGEEYKAWLEQQRPAGADEKTDAAGKSGTRASADKPADEQPQPKRRSTSSKGE